MDCFSKKNELYVLVPSFSLSGIRGRMDSGDTDCDLSAPAPAQPINLQGQLDKVNVKWTCCVNACCNCKWTCGLASELSPELLGWTRQSVRTVTILPDVGVQKAAHECMEGSTSQMLKQHSSPVCGGKAFKPCGNKCWM